jgi:hypothetical protein
MKRILFFLLSFSHFFSAFSQGTISDCENAIIKKLISASETKLGCVYDWGAAGPLSFDCSGFTSYIFQSVGINLPRVARDQYNSGKVITITNIRQGDLVFFISTEQDIEVGHVGLAISDYRDGDFQFIHSCYTIGVCVSNYRRALYCNSFIGARRIILCNNNGVPWKAVNLVNHPGPDSVQSRPMDQQENGRKEGVDEFPNDFFNYTVKKGEKLLDISRRFSVPVENLMKWNNIKSNVLQESTKVKIYLTTDGF